MSEIETPMCPNCDDVHLCECKSDYEEGDACYECPECEEIFYEVDGELMPEEEYDSRINAALVREAAEVYESRKMLKSY